MQENNPNNEIIDLIIRSLRKELDVEEEKILHRIQFSNWLPLLMLIRANWLLIGRD